MSFARDRAAPSHAHRRADRRASRGQAFVELALVTPVLLMIVLAGIDLGRLFFAQIAVTNAAREGAMVAAETPSSWEAGNACNASTNAVMCAVVNEGHGFVSVTPADVSMSCAPSCSKTYGNKVTVTVTGHFTVLTPVIWVFTGGQSVTFQRQATADVIVTPAVPTAAPTAAPTATPTAGPTATPTAAPTPTPTPTAIVCGTPIVNFTYSQQNKNWPVDFVSTSTPTTGGCAITYWRWEFGDGTSSAGSVPNASHDYGSANKGVTFSVTLTVTTPSGTYAITKSVTTKS
jgi:Flp pilus assembly protein TadG